MKKVKDMEIEWSQGTFQIDGEKFTGKPANKNELKELESAGFTQDEPCGRQMCYQGWVWVLIDAPSGQGCQWYKTAARCNE